MLNGTRSRTKGALTGDNDEVLLEVRRTLGAVWLPLFTHLSLVAGAIRAYAFMIVPRLLLLVVSEIDFSARPGLTR